MNKSKFPLSYFAQNLFIIIGIILIWRGIWYVLDELDKLLFGGSHTRRLLR